MISRWSWVETKDEILCGTPEGPLFRDTTDHWFNAVCRLLCMTPEEAKRWVEAVFDAAVESGGWRNLEEADRREALRRGSSRHFGLDSGSPVLPGELINKVVSGLQLETSWGTGMYGDPSLVIAGPREPAHGMLVDFRGGEPVIAAPPVYEESYFEGGEKGFGYGAFAAQEGWRMEKSHRQARQVGALALYTGLAPQGVPRLLDVGSGYGYFRQAMLEAGWRHDGVELSRHACRVAKSRFGFETRQGGLETVAGERYDCITVFDTLEHLPDPQGWLKDLVRLLAPGGLCIVRTPNLQALEASVFGVKYHSLKREHLHYFSPKSLCAFFLSAGLEPVFLTTEAHLLRGFLRDRVDLQARLLEGSDIFAAGRLKGGDDG